MLLYLSGHGGDGFFKVHDSQELSAERLAQALEEMRLRGRYRNLLVVADTCELHSLLITSMQLVHILRSCIIITMIMKASLTRSVCITLMYLIYRVISVSPFRSSCYHTFGS